VITEKIARGKTVINPGGDTFMFPSGFVFCALGAVGYEFRCGVQLSQHVPQVQLLSPGGQNFPAFWVLSALVEIPSHYHSATFSL
jgi:hypothetical protein